jgi:hypothetical protein
MSALPPKAAAAVAFMSPRHKDDAWRIASTIAKLPSVPRDVLKDIPRPKTSAGED